MSMRHLLTSPDVQYVLACLGVLVHCVGASPFFCKADSLCCRCDCPRARPVALRSSRFLYMCICCTDYLRRHFAPYLRFRPGHFWCWCWLSFSQVTVPGSVLHPLARKIYLKLIIVSLNLCPRPAGSPDKGADCRLCASVSRVRSCWPRLAGGPRRHAAPPFVLTLTRATSGEQLRVVRFACWAAPASSASWASSLAPCH